jgi:hypothetical protein
MKRDLMKKCLICVLLLLLPSCSFLLVESLPENYKPRRRVLSCTTNRAAPVIDTVLTLTNIASAIYVASLDNVKNKGTSVMLGLSVAALWANSAIYGYKATNACEEAKEEAEGGPYLSHAYRFQLAQ